MTFSSWLFFALAQLSPGLALAGLVCFVLSVAALAKARKRFQLGRAVLMLLCYLLGSILVAVPTTIFMMLLLGAVPGGGMGQAGAALLLAMMGGCGTSALLVGLGFLAAARRDRLPRWFG